MTDLVATVYQRLPWQLRAAEHRFRERALLIAMRRAPDALKNRVALHRMGELTVCKASLHDVEVPDVTIQQLMDAMDEPDVS